MAGLLSRERIIAGSGFNRWLVPPAALAIHLSIGQVYAFSVFKIPLSRAIGITQSTAGDWKFTQLQWIFTLAIVWLGLSAAIAGRWLERAGPRKGGVVAACCWGGGFVISALGVRLHQLWLIYVGYGFIGGWGLGLGYISPVSTLIKWFPDRRGMATGMAIMGFGGGALIAAPLSDALMKHFATATSVGVSETFLTMGIIYFVAMMCGAFGYRLPPTDWKPAGWSPPAQQRVLVTTKHVHVDRAWRTPQFWLIWIVLCMNVSAGIGILEQASPMIQEIFKGAVTASAAAGFVGLLSLFNIGGRIFWASLSDLIRRKPTYFIFFTLGAVLYASIPFAGKIGSVPLFVACCLVILTMYGGGFATIPAYIADIFGTQFVGAIHGRILTAWSAAGVLGPFLVNYIREYQIDHGVPKADAYNLTMYVMVGLLVVGFFANLAIRPVAEEHYMTDAQLATERRLIHEPNAGKT
ncbi:MAG TPA: OFA family MFS transporter [Gemmatimonadales bacterium]|nr:OFA family MFS transporter [Gemmatimonadales bacterium]